MAVLLYRVLFAFVCLYDLGLSRRILCFRCLDGDSFGAQYWGYVLLQHDKKVKRCPAEIRQRTTGVNSQHVFRYEQTAHITNPTTKNNRRTRGKAMTNLEAEFAKWARAVDFHSFGTRQKVMMKMSFFSGALVGFSVMCDVGVSDEDDSVCEKKLTKLHDELFVKMNQSQKELEGLNNANH